MRTTDTHVYFWGGEFSNFHPCKFGLIPWEPDVNMELDDSYKSSEQAYMAAKAVFFGDFLIFNEILKAQSPREAKDLGRKVRGFNPVVWDIMKFSYMVFVNYCKYSQNPELKKLLLDTGNKTLVEASPVDLIWGVGFKEDDDLILDEKNWKGQNLLGKALMEVRKLLQVS